MAFIIAIAALFGLLFYSGGCGRATPEITEAPQTPFIALFFADTQADPQIGDYSALGELLALAAEQAQNPALVIFGGDTVNDGADTDEWQAFWQAAASTLDGLTTAAAAGNHDNHALLAEQFSYPAPAPLNPGEGFFYSLDMGGVHFIMLDSNIMGAGRQEDIEWLRDDLQSAPAQQADWRVAVMHHPMWPLTENLKDIQRAATMREHFLPLLEAHGVDLILTGHQHLYGRSLPKSGDATAPEGSGIVQIMAASGAKEPYTLGNADYVAVSAAPPNYLLLRADSDRLTVTAYNGQNEAFDTCILKHKNDETWRIRVSEPAGAEVWSFSEAELKAALLNLDAVEQPRPFAHVYSTINNWPASRFYAAQGYSVADILKAAGLYETAQTVTFRAADGYEIRLTREQILAPQYCYPAVGENDSEAEEVFSIIAYRWREGTDDLGKIADNKPSLIIGQRNPFDHNNPAYVVGVVEMVVDDAPCTQWSPATAFPLPGPIAAGETVKLQHPDYGLVKLHYTLDGSEPTLLSPLYNPSTYQPELNKPIPITEQTTIKVLVSGYGKADSEIAVLEFTPPE
jgi:hypothetical protein